MDVPCKVYSLKMYAFPPLLFISDVNLNSCSCMYGERCKFLHETQQQSRPSGSNQQQKPNPFGFGVQSSSQPRAAADFASKHNQFKVLSPLYS